MSTLLPTSQLEEIAWKSCALLGTQKVDPSVVSPSRLSVETGLGYFFLFHPDGKVEAFGGPGKKGKKEKQIKLEWF